MKKFFEKHDLFKLAFICMMVVCVLSWIIPYTYFDGTNFDSSTYGITRVGLFDITTYSMLGLYYFTTFIVLVFAIGGFYKFLGVVPAYQSLTDKIAKIFNGKEKAFAAISILLYAVLASLTTNYIGLFALVPFSLTILSKLKSDKATALASTFGGILIGILCSTYSTQVTGQLVNTLKVEYNYQLLAVIILAVISYLLLTFFVITRIDKKDEANLLVDPFAPKLAKNAKVVNKNVGCLGLGLVLCLVFINVVMAYIGWADAFGITVFGDALKAVQEASIFNFPVFNHILGQSVYEFGKWDGFSLVSILVIASLIIKSIYRIPLDTLIESYANGFKKISKNVFLMLMVYAILILSVVYPTVPYIVSKLIGLESNVFTWFAGSIIASIFGVDFQYINTLIGTYYATFNNVSLAGLALQTGYGLVQFISPTSMVLVFGLALVDLKFKDYLKFIWKFLLALLVVILIMLAVVAYV